MHTLMELVSTYRLKDSNYFQFFSYDTIRIKIFVYFLFIILSFLVQEMLNLQKLQNLASLQQSPISSLANIQGLAGLTSAAALNSPLNLSVGSAGAAGASSLPSCPTGGAMGNNAQMPQLILASGQLIQGIQGAQLLIPTSQGIYFSFCEIILCRKVYHLIMGISRTRHTNYSYNTSDTTDKLK